MANGYNFLRGESMGTVKKENLYQFTYYSSKTIFFHFEMYFAKL